MKKHYYLLLIGIHGSFIKSYDSWRVIMRSRDFYKSIHFYEGFCDIITRKEAEKIIGKKNIPILISEKIIKVENSAYQFRI